MTCTEQIYVSESLEGRSAASLQFWAQLSADWYLAFNVVTNMYTIRRVGNRLFDEITAHLLREHQEAYFLQGLKKLGLDNDASDPIRCARYHALSNAPGGLNTTYGIESEDRAWIFYNLPYLRDRWTGTSFVIYEDYYAANMAGWHANNGVLLGNLGLSFVVTHLVSRGDPYDAGYFIDTHRTLHQSERIRIAFGTEPPPDMTIHEPSFDATLWPPLRLAKVQLRHMVDYASAGVLANQVKLGPELAATITELTLRSLLFQTWQDLVRELRLDAAERSAAQTAACVFAAVHDLAGDPLSVAGHAGRIGVSLRRHWLTSSGEWVGHTLADEIQEGVLRAWQCFARHLDRGLTVSADWESGEWTFSQDASQTAAAPRYGATQLSAADALAATRTSGLAL